MQITHKVYDVLPEEASYIRQTVFMKEQGFSYEFDDTDYTAKHILLFADDKPVAVGRFFSDNGIEWHIGRLAVLKEYRGLNLGKEIMLASEKEIKALGGSKAVLSAQVQAKGFYEKCGYTAKGDIYFDEHVEHIDMEKNL